jgi:uncharacterized damage-inducible protein DinB
MNRRLILPSVAAAGIPALVHAQAPTGFAKTWLTHCMEHWADTKEYTMAVLDAMPSDGMSFKPAPIQQTFAAMMTHLAATNVVYFRAFQAVPVPATLPVSRADLAKSVPFDEKPAVRKYVAATFDYVAQVLPKLTQRDLDRTDLVLFPNTKPHSGIDVFLRAYMHTAHHRGQATSYLRGKGIAPPVWRFEPYAR